MYTAIASATVSATVANVYWVTLVNPKTEHEVGFRVASKSDRVVDILAAIKAQRATMRLQGRYEVHEYFAV